MTFVNTAQNETVDISFSIFTFSSRSAGLKANLMADNQRKFQRGSTAGKRYERNGSADRSVSQNNENVQRYHDNSQDCFF